MRTSGAKALIDSARYGTAEPVPFVQSIFRTLFRPYISTKAPRNRRSLGCARDDKKERVAVRRGPLPRERALAKDTVVVRPFPLATALSLQ
jgi:hypothetical protein